MKKKFILSENLDLNDSDIEIDKYDSMPPDYAGAIADMAKSRKRKLEVEKELKKTADDFLKGKKTEVKEGVVVKRNRRINEAKGQVEDLYDDMWTFIYDLFSTEGNRFFKPKNPLGKKYGKFEASTVQDGFSEITTDTDGNIVLQTEEKEKFDDVKDICSKYKIKCGEVKPLKSGKFYMTIKVPTDKSGDPMGTKEYFDSIGIDIKDVR